MSKTFLLSIICELSTVNCLLNCGGYGVAAAQQTVAQTVDLTKLQPYDII